MSDLISRQWLIECVSERWIKFDTEMDENRFIHLVRDMAPSVQPERKTGHWEFQGYRMFSCTHCSYIASQGQLESWKTNTSDSDFPLFCPNCGADMRDEQE